VWPHDTAIVGAGLARYGHKRDAMRILSGMFDASIYMDLNRLPELMCGFTRKQGQGPTLYPVACSPQAWSSAAVFQMLEACLGLDVDAVGRRIAVTSPCLPPWLGWLELRGVQVGASRVDLRFRRVGEGCDVDLVSQEGPSEIAIEVAPPST
jgi:glycogen debranching enzyme